MNIAAPDQYLSIVVPGRMYKEAYRKAGLAPKNLSRCLEDAGTLSSPLVPWNTCGAFMMGALGVNPLVYLPFAVFYLCCPLVSAVLGFTGWTMEKAEKDERRAE
jgi:NhaC family Na+:H+ antiporter